MTPAELGNLMPRHAATVDQAVSKVSKEPAPDPFKENWQALSCASSWRDSTRHEHHLSRSHSRGTIRGPAPRSLVFLYGQDIGTFGGAFKATKNLNKEFPGRVFDAPISEDAMVGMAVGAAVEGARPIVEMQFADFSSVGFNQIVNQAATLYWRTNTPCPITIRLPSGGTAGSGPFHSQSMEAIYAHYPGSRHRHACHGGGCLLDAARQRRSSTTRSSTASTSSSTTTSRPTSDRRPRTAHRQGAHRPPGTPRHHRHLQRHGA
jgi:hypothetical protein